jgi:hypothetical protein
VTAQQMAVLDTLLVKPANSTTTPFNRLKQTPGSCNPGNDQALGRTARLAMDMIDSDPLWEALPSRSGRTRCGRSA